MGPKDLPKDILAKVNDAVKTAMADPASDRNWKRRACKFGGAQSPDEFAAFVKAELAKYQRLVKELNVRATSRARNRSAERRRCRLPPSR